VILPRDEVGSGDPLVLLHAGIADRRMWSEHLEPFANAGYRVVAMDLPGYGDARIESGPHSPWEDVIDTLDELEISSAALVGNSFGGAVALRVATVAPDRGSALVLVSAPSPAMRPSAELEAAWTEEETALENGDVDAAVDSVVRAWTLPDASSELRQLIADMQRRAFDLQEDATSFTEADDPIEEHPERLANLQAPALCLAGEYDRGEFQQSAQELAQALPHARFGLIPGAGHLAPLETPVAFRRLVVEFLGE
jgi:3-oxoadipate enol-lactonase